jgi:hypothetical protein
MEDETRRDAQAQGFTYYNGAPCGMGHTLRYVEDGECADCREPEACSPGARRQARLRAALIADRAAEVKAYEAVLRGAQAQYARSGLVVHIDHFIPLARGGLHVPENLRLVPAEDNLRKRDRLDSELDRPVRVLIHH